MICRILAVGLVMGTVLAPAALAQHVGAGASPADFALRDGDTVVFLGDSITAEGTCGRVVETYTLLRYPQRKVRFINAGWGGDTAAGGLKRLTRDVFDRGATLLIVAYGINDIGWGAKADDEHRKLYLDSIRQIVTQCKQHKPAPVRVFICSAAATGADPDKAQGDFLQLMCADGMKIAQSMGEGAGAIDVLGEMRTIQRRVKHANLMERDPAKQVTLHAADTIHLNELGQIAMGYAIIKGLGAPAEVSSATIDAAGAKRLSQSGCAVSNLTGTRSGIEFDRFDEGLPLNFGLFGALHFRFIPIPETLNRYMLCVKNLDPGKYDLKVDDRAVGAFTSEQLSQGVNLSSATADPWIPGGPWEAQAWLVNMLARSRWEAAQTTKFYDDYLKHNPNRDELSQQTADVNEKIETLARKMAQPVKYHFVIRPAASKEPSK